MHWTRANFGWRTFKPSFWFERNLQIVDNCIIAFRLGTILTTFILAEQFGEIKRKVFTDLQKTNMTYYSNAVLAATDEPGKTFARLRQIKNFFKKKVQLSIQKKPQPAFLVPLYPS